MVLEDPAIDTVMSGFLCMKKLHYISYKVLCDAYLDYKAQLVLGEGDDLRRERVQLDSAGLH